MSSNQSMAASSRLGWLFVSRDNQLINEYSLAEYHRDVLPDEHQKELLVM